MDAGEQANPQAALLELHTVCWFNRERQPAHLRRLPALWVVRAGSAKECEKERWTSHRNNNNNNHKQQRMASTHISTTLNSQGACLMLECRLLQQEEEDEEEGERQTYGQAAAQEQQAEDDNAIASPESRMGR